MKRVFFHPGPSDLGSGLGLLVLRFGFGGVMLFAHGWEKLTNLSSQVSNYKTSLIGLPAKVEVYSLITAETLAAAFLILGFFGRWAAAGLAFTMAVAAFVVHGGDEFAQQEKAVLFFIAFLALVVSGPGKYSVDARIN